MRKYLFAGITFAGVIISSHTYAAENISQMDACHLLDSKPYINKASEYTPLYEGSDDYMCGTQYFDITSFNTTGLSNNIAYYVRGTQDHVKKMMIMLNVNQSNKKALDVAKSYYIDGSFELLKKTFPNQAGKNSDIIQQISKGKDGEWSIGEWTVSSIKDTWPTGKGYEYRFTIIKK